MLSKILRTTILAGALMLAGAALLSPAPAARAVGADDFKAALEKAGYTVTVDPATVKHATLSVEGRIFTVTKDGKTARVELLDYGSATKLAADWNAANAQGPTPKTASADFDGKVPLWNNDSVLLVDYRAPNDAGIAGSVQNIYLGPGGTGGAEPPPAGSATPGAPKTGNSLMTSEDRSPLLPALVVFYAITLVALCTAVVLRGSRES
jgi:hypothetical protein